MFIALGSCNSLLSPHNAAIYDQLIIPPPLLLAEILNSLPPFLRMDVACSMNLDLVKNVPVLAALGDDCMAMLVTKLKPLQLVPGETVVKKGTVGHEMYFITEGTLDVYIDIEDEYPKCSLEQGSYFGEPAILSSKPVKRSASIQARVFSQLER